MTSCRHNWVVVSAGRCCRYCGAYWPDTKPSTLAALLRLLWVADASLEVQRAHIGQLWHEPEYRPILEPLEQQLRAGGLLP